MEKNCPTLFSAFLVFLLLGACSSIESAAGQVESWVSDSLEDYIETDDWLSIPALGGFGVNAMIEARLNELNNDDTEKIATARMEAILEAIENQDSNKIYDMFSANAKNEAVELHERIEMLFSLMDSNVVSWEKSIGRVPESNHYGIKTKEYHYVFYVYTTNEIQYIFNISECLVDDTDPDNIGLYSIIAYEASRKDEMSIFSDPGIKVLE